MSFVTNTVGSVGSTVKNTLTPQQKKEQEHEQEAQTQQQPSSSSNKPLESKNLADDVGSTATSAAESVPKPQNDAPPKDSGGGFMSGITNAGSSIASTAQSGVTSSFNVTADLAKGGAQLASDAARAGASISQTVAKSGLDFSVGVVGGTADLAGTAVGGIVNTAAQTSGKVFEPVASGLNAIEGFDKLGVGEGLQKINGLPVGAVQQIGSWTMQALNMSGKTPTFFDADGDGTVSFDDTTKGLIVLGLDEKNSKYAAYALHGIFSYPTGTSWVPTDTSLPITVSNMSRTRWGKNWGQYDRMDWVQDVDINQFFAASDDDATWQEKFKKGRQYFGVLLLIFEWGTTWPFIMPDVPVEQIPFREEIGKVVRTLVLPTVFSNFQRAREGKVDAGSQPPAKEAPSGPNDA